MADNEKAEVISNASIFRSLTRLEMKQDQILVGTKIVEESLAKHDLRISALEKRQTYMAGVGAALLAVAAFARELWGMMTT